MLNHSHYMQSLINFAKSNSEYMTYAASIVNAEGDFTKRLWQGYDIMKIATFQRCADVFAHVPNAPKLVAEVETALAEPFFIERQERFAAAHREKMSEVF